MKQIVTERNRELQEFEKEVPPSNYMVWAILSTLLCCMPLGIVSIIKSLDVNSKWNAGDYEGAKRASESAKKWAIISGVTGIVLIVLFFILYFVILAAFLSGIDPHSHY